jgi:hypothetical protein
MDIFYESALTPFSQAFSLSKLTQAVTLLAFIWEVPGVNFSQNTGNPD